MANPVLSQGTLNRVRGSIIIASFPSLNITPAFMGKNFITVDFDEDYTDQIETATGVVNSPEPYIMATVTVGVLRTLPLALAWREQAKATSILGHISVHSDTTAFPVYHFRSVVIKKFDPGAYDGKDPVSRLTLRGVYDINNDLWNL